MNALPLLPVRLTVLLYLSSVLIAHAVPALAQAPPYYWSQRLGNASSESVTSVGIDASGYIYLAGNFTGTLNVGGVNLVSNGADDIFLAKYGPNGSHKWSKSYGAVLSEYVLDMAVDGSGNIMLTGQFNGIIDFGVGILTSMNTDGYAAKFNADGATLWSLRFGGTGLDTGNSLSVDAGGNILVMGLFTGTANFGGANLVSAGADDVFLVKYNSSGVHQWSNRYGGTSSDIGTAVTTDIAGNVFLTGYFNGTAAFGGGNLVSAGQADIFLAKYLPSGTHHWSTRFGGLTGDIGRSVAADDLSNVYLAASFEGTVSFGGSNLVSAGAADIALAKYNSTGLHQWSQRFGNTTTDGVAELVSDASGNLALTGSHTLAIDFGGGSLPGHPDFDIFIAKFNTGGVHQWSQSYGTSGNSDRGVGVRMDASGNIVLTGVFAGTLDLGGGPLQAQGSQDIYLARFASPGEPLITAIADVGKDQGRAVRISFLRSGHDKSSDPTPILEYAAYRRIDTLPAPGVADGATMAPGEVAISGWEHVGTVPAFGEVSYSMIVPTLADSTIASGQHYSTFFVRAATSTLTLFYDSPLDSGYSLDNLPPGAPLNLTHAAGNLEWDESPARDFDYFTVHGSNVDAFGSATVVDYSVAPAMDVTASPYVYYFVTATDFSGNEGEPAKVNTLSGAGGTPSSYVLSVSNHPNPFNPRTIVSYTVPSRGAVRVAVYDTRGAHVTTLFEGERASGAYSVDWNGQADTGVRAASGIYFARVEHNGVTRSKKMVLLK